MPFAVRAGGHSLAGFSAIDDGLVIDLRALTADRHRSPAHGARGSVPASMWAELDAATQRHGLAVTGGRISDTGVAGLTLGSGSGWLERRHGLTADCLRRATVVTASGEIVHASEDENPDLFWALRGGGGNFGIVTEFEFELHEVGPTVLGGPLLFDYERGGEVLRAYREIMDAADDDLGGCAVIHLAPPAPFVPPDLVGRPVLGIMVAAFADLDRSAELVAPIRALGPLVDAVAPIPYTQLQRLIDEGSPAGLHGQFEAAFMDGLPMAPSTTAAGMGGRIQSPFTEILIQPLGGAYGRVEPDATALAHRDAGWMYHALGQWTDPADTPRNRAWTADLVDGMAPTRGARPTRTTSRRTGRSACGRSTATRSTIASSRSRTAGTPATCSAATRTSGLPNSGLAVLRRPGSDGCRNLRWTFRWARPPAHICTSTASTRCSMARARSTPSRSAPRSSASRPSGSPITAS